MRFFIVSDENTSYYYLNRRGIYCKKTNVFREGREIYGGGKDGFGLFRNQSTHIVCADRDNNIIYIKPPEKPVLLIPGQAGIVPYDFTLTQIGNKLHLLYKTDYENEILLFACLLEKSEKPACIAKLCPQTTDYFCAGSEIYYTSDKNILCRADLAGGPVTEICRDGIMPCTADGLVTYKKGNFIYVNNNAVAEDSTALNPTIFCTNGATYLQWRSGDFIKYRRMENDVWSDTVKFMGTDSVPHIIRVINGSDIRLVYGYNGRPSIKV